MDSHAKNSKLNAHSQREHNSMNTLKSPRSKWDSLKFRIATLIVVAIVPMAAFIAVNRVLLSAGEIDSDKYQAVFLIDNRVFFGKIHDYNTRNPYMTDVYYFQSSEAVAGNETGPVTQTLVRLKDEIHKPEDKLILNRESILFIENLSGEGSVVQAIKDENS